MVERVTIQVVLAMPDQQQLIEFSVAKGTSAREAVWQSVEHGLDTAGMDIQLGLIPIGVYGLRVDDDYIVNEGERVEIYRPLQQDPKELRRKRARQS
ncbi:MAG: RnfH family protein [Granulosicoccus sp.]